MKEKHEIIWVMEMCGGHRRNRLKLSDRHQGNRNLLHTTDHSHTTSHTEKRDERLMSVLFDSKEGKIIMEAVFETLPPKHPKSRKNQTPHFA